MSNNRHLRAEPVYEFAQKIQAISQVCKLHGCIPFLPLSLVGHLQHWCLAKILEIGLIIKIEQHSTTRYCSCQATTIVVQQRKLESLSFATRVTTTIGRVAYYCTFPEQAIYQGWEFVRITLRRLKVQTSNYVWYLMSSISTVGAQLGTLCLSATGQDFASTFDLPELQNRLYIYASCFACVKDNFDSSARDTFCHACI